MTSLDRAGERAAIDIADRGELARLRAGGRDVFAREDLEDQLGQGPLILDGLRARPRYFDGRFLTGADLTRDQDYVRQRQADMARASGAGVISGLEVSDFGQLRGQTLRIEAGLGLTPAGDVVMIRQRRDIALLDLPLSRELDAAMGLSEVPRVPLGRRTGLFILALRPVEFTANPIAAYPRSIVGQRTLEDGDIIEATAVTLIPYPERSGAADLGAARAAVAREIFDGDPAGLPQEVLPLAMLALEGGALRWLDMAMVRRETGVDSGVQAAFGGRPRALAEAHLVQHRGHLASVIEDLALRGGGASFAAAEHFALLPPAGPMPATAVRPDDLGFSQLYFPAGVDADLAFVPHDELGALVEEALPLRPIDLHAAASDLDATGVVILVPVTRERFQRFENALPTTGIAVASGASAATTRPAFDLLATIVARRDQQLMADAGSAVAVAAEAERLRVQAWHAAWHEAIAALPRAEGQPPLLWYTRRRAIPYRAALAGIGVPVAGDDVATGRAVAANIARLKLSRRFAALNGKATPQATARIISLLASPALVGSDILTVSALADLERLAEPEPTEPRPTGEPPLDMLRPAIPRPGGLDAMTGGLRPTINPAVLGRLRRASADLASARTDLTRATLSVDAGLTTAAREDTELTLSEGEVLDVAQDYAAPRLGEGLERLAAALDEGWPDVRTAVWFGGSGRALATDAAFARVPAEKLADFASLIGPAIKDQDQAAVDDVLEQMRS